MLKKPLRSQARNIVFNVYQRLLDEQGAEQTQSSTLSHVQALTGVSNTTIRRIVAEGRSNRSVFITPGKKKKGGKNTALPLLMKTFLWMCCIWVHFQVLIRDVNRFEENRRKNGFYTYR
uniref:Uncharacterized protein n=1 Tax=Bombyx mori TaxID=7091 RepID=A0A8R2DN45_BOMMO|nr:uncharacterized protein LOC101742907 [Bombyx mori]